MHQLSSAFKRTNGGAGATTVTAQSDLRPRAPDAKVGTTLCPSILVVEDDLCVRQMLCAALGVWGYEVFLAENGQEGLQVVVSQQVDGILLDINMPVMSGQTMLDELRWLGYQTPVVVMSGGLDVSSLWQLLKEGAQGFAVKPFSLPALQKICIRVFGTGGGGDVYSDAHGFMDHV